MRSEGAALAFDASGVENRLLAAAAHRTGDRPPHEQNLETAETETANCDVFRARVLRKERSPATCKASLEAL